MSCPICGQNDFYIKDPDDEYECYDFNIKNGEIHFNEAVNSDDLPEVNGETEVFCNCCSWHGKLETIQKPNEKEE